MKVSIIAVTAVAALLLGFLFASTPVSSATDASPPPATNVDLPIQEAFALFTDWMQTYQIVFPDQKELEYRFSVFKENIEYINAHNLRNDSTITLGTNAFSHWTFEEFKQRNTYKGKSMPVMPKGATKTSTNTSAAVALDWRDFNAVTPVVDQGSCGSCFTFSSAGAIEGASAIATGQLQELSKQQLLDCTRRAGNAGCRGGFMDKTFAWVVKNKGICDERSYPYVGRVTRCKRCKKAVVLQSYQNVPPNDENALLEAANIGPVAIAVEASNKSWQFYKSGIVTKGCGDQLDHAVLLVGYGSDITLQQEFWTVKNSWGTSWGESGYIRLQRGTNMCGIAIEPSYPIVA